MCTPLESKYNSSRKGGKKCLDNLTRFSSPFHALEISTREEGLCGLSGELCASSMRPSGWQVESGPHALCPSVERRASRWETLHLTRRDQEELCASMPQARFSALRMDSPVVTSSHLQCLTVCALTVADH